MRFLLLILCVVDLSGPALSAVNQPRLEDLRKKYETSREKVRQSDQKRREILRGIFDLNKKIRKISDKKGDLSDNLYHVESNAKQLAGKIAKLEQTIAQQRKKLRMRLRALYKLTGQAWLRTVFSSMSSSDLERNLRFLSILSERDYKLLKRHRANVAQLKLERRLLRQEVQKLVRVKKEIHQNESELLKEQRRKAHYARQLEIRQSKHIARMRGLKGQTSQLLNQVESKPFEDFLAENYFFEQKGRLEPPVAGRVVRPYGLMRSQSPTIRLRHKGWLYRAEPEAVVTSVFSGEVHFAGKILGYGQVLIIGHGDHYYSVYGFLGDLLVDQGEQVSAQQVIARTSGVKEPSLYFEIRHYSSPEDPSRWVKQEEIKVSALDEATSS